MYHGQAPPPTGLVFLAAGPEVAPSPLGTPAVPSPTRRQPLHGRASMKGSSPNFACAAPPSLRPSHHPRFPLHPPIPMPRTPAGIEVPLAVVDASLNSDLIAQQNIQGFPAHRWFEAGTVRTVWPRRTWWELVDFVEVRALSCSQATPPPRAPNPNSAPPEIHPYCVAGARTVHAVLTFSACADNIFSSFVRFLRLTTSPRPPPVVSPCAVTVG